MPEIYRASSENLYFARKPGIIFLSPVFTRFVQILESSLQGEYPFPDMYFSPFTKKKKNLFLQNTEIKLNILFVVTQSAIIF